MSSQHRLTRALVWLVLLAALVTAPVFLVAEQFDREHVMRVLASNGVCVVFCAGLLAVLNRGHVQWTARILVYGLLGIVGSLAWTNGEGVHVNVVNFVLVTVLAGVLLERRALIVVGATSAALMAAIAWRQTVAPPGEELSEARLESMVQFLPTYAVIVLVLWLHSGSETADTGSGATSPRG